MFADSTRLAQVFLNLLNNAAKFTDNRGAIKLTAEVKGGDLVVTVADTGIGISAKMLPVIFDMFAQADRSLELWARTINEVWRIHFHFLPSPRTHHARI